MRLGVALAALEGGVARRADADDALAGSVKCSWFLHIQDDFEVLSREDGDVGLGHNSHENGLCTQPQHADRDGDCPEEIYHALHLQADLLL